MGIKDLFGQKKLSKPIPSSDIEELGFEVESVTHIEKRIEEKNRFIPDVDFTSASNFAKYGSAEKYYESSIKRIYNQYPYDGSKAEVKEFLNESSYLDLYLLDQKYPTSTGFINLGLTSMTHQAKSDGWGHTATTPEYIDILGGPHTSSAGMIGKPLSEAFGDPIYRTSPNANTYDTDIYTTADTVAQGRAGSRESNLKFNLADGLTVEFWFKKEAYDTDETGKEVILDLWNGIETGSHTDAAYTINPGYGRLILYLDGEASDSAFKFHLASGSTVWDGAFGGTDHQAAGFNQNTWQHYAITFKSASVDDPQNPSAAKSSGLGSLISNFYVSGTHIESEISTSTTGTFGEVTGSLKARIGALQWAPSGTSFDPIKSSFAGASKLTASLDEFRFWKTRRSSEDIGRNWFTQVGGGANSDIANADLGFYFKFNEGILDDTTIDSTVLDYSGRISNGNWVGYPGSTARNTGSAMAFRNARHEGGGDTPYRSHVSASAEFEDPIIYPSHPDVVALEHDLRTSGSFYDFQNPASLYHSLPSFMAEEDEDGALSEITQIMASYLDTLHLQVEALPRIKDAYLLSSSFKPVPFSDRLLESHGFQTSEIFANANILAQIGNRDEVREFDLDLQEVKNRIYKNIYNVLVHLYKSKGTEEAFRNLIRTFGVDEELIKINLYGNNVTHAINDNVKFVASKTKAINFDIPAHRGATVVQWSGSSTNVNAQDTYALSGTEAHYIGGYAHNAKTVEAQVIFPAKLPSDHEAFEPTTFLSASVFGYVAPVEFSTLGYQLDEWDSAAAGKNDFQLYAVRPKEESKDVHFVLKNRHGETLASSSLYKDVYDNQKWTFGIRTRHAKYNHGISHAHLTGGLFHGTGSNLGAATEGTGKESNTVLEFYGVNTDLDVVANEFYLTVESLPHEYHTLQRRYYAGAQRENYTGSVQYSSDIKLLSVRHWESYVDNESIKAHSIDPLNYGTKNPSQATHFKTTGSLDGEWIPEMETLALHWNFDNVTGSDDLGNFLVHDISSGSVERRTRYPGNFGKTIGDQHPALGYGFTADNTSSFDVNYISTARLQPPEVMNSVDMVNIVDRDDNKFTRESRPINYFFAFEKSMYRTISEEMLKMFSAIVEFNNLFGRPVDKYRNEYKDMKKLRSLFFERVNNTPDLEKYVSYYKWIDGALGEMLQQLVPASADASDGIRTMVENHELDRSKYRHKFPNVKHVEPDLTAHIYGIEEHMYDWEYGHAPLLNPPTTATATFVGTADLAGEDGTNLILTNGDGSTVTFHTDPTKNFGDTSDDGGDRTWIVNTGGDFSSAGIRKATQAFHIACLTAIAAGELDMTAVPATDTGTQTSFTLTQNLVGENGNTPITLITGMTANGETAFLGGKTVGPQNVNTLWWKDRAERSHIDFGTPDAVDRDREHYRQIAPSHISGTGPVFAQSDKTEYTGSAYALRNFTKIYRFGTSVESPIHGGSNYGLTKPGVFNKKPDAISQILRYGGTPDDTAMEHLITVHGIEERSSSIEAVEDRPTPYELRKVQKYHDVTVQGIEESSDDYGYYRTKGSLLTPFTMYSSSVTTGYQGELSRIGHKIDLTNMHSDTYGDDYEVPMQGPFTEKFVGGNQHRHVDLNRVGPLNEHDAAHAVDADASRPEKWVLKFDDSAGTFQIKARHSYETATREKPNARYYRDEVAKRPVNIKNIKMSTSASTNIVSGTLRASIGNYTRDYEIAQTSDRSVNNRALTRADGFSTSNTTEYFDTFVDGLIDYAKPVRERTEHVFVERFSAPGGPETAGDNNGGPGLDVASAQYSPYNDMNSRNSTVRIPLNTLHSEKSEQFGIRSGSVALAATYTNVDASFHKVNRNTLQRLVYADENWVDDDDGGTVITSSVHDNFYVQYAIPRSDTQYSWITGSLVSAAELGSVSRLDGLFSSSTGIDASLKFTTGSVAGGIGTEDFTYLDTANNYADTVGLNQYIYEPVSASLGRLGYPIGTEPGVLIKGDVPLNADGFVELPTASYFNALMHHRGNRGYPSWRQIRVGENPVVREWKKNNLYVLNTQSISIAVHDDSYYRTYRKTDGSLVSFQEPPVVSVHYPVEYGLVGVMGTVTSTDILGSYGNLIDFFANPDLESQVRTCDVDSDPCPPTHIKIKDIYNQENPKGGTSFTPGAPPIPEIDATAWASAWGDASSTINRYNANRPSLDSLKLKQVIFPKAENAYLDRSRRRSGYENNFWRDNRPARATSTKWLPLLAAQSETDGLTTYSRWNLDANHGVPLTGRSPAFNASASTRTEGILQNCATQMNPEGYNYNMVTSSMLYAAKHMLPNTGSLRCPTGPQGIDGNFIDDDLNPEYSGAFGYTPPGGGITIWEAGALAGYYQKSNPNLDEPLWVSASSEPYDDGYDDYVQEMRTLNKDYSIVPEFRISDHIEYYMKKKNGNFLAEASGTFQIPGATTTGSYPQNSENSEFYKTFSNSDFMKHFEPLQKEHNELIDPSEITLTCKAIIKFNPHDGFYPSEMLGDLYEQFSGSYFKYVKTNSNNITLSNFPNMGPRPFITPMFAPGIWFNMIKSGLAVDFPVFTGSFVMHNPLVSDSSGSSEFHMLSTSSIPRRTQGEDGGHLLGWDYRVPFEAAIDPERYLANWALYDMYQHPSCSLDLTSSWGGEGDPLYKMKAHNALASMIDFYLPGQDNRGELTTLTSRPEKEFGRFKFGTTYGMRVKLRKSYNLPRQVGNRFTRGYLTPHDSLTDYIAAGVKETFTMYSRPSAFGPAVAGRNNLSPTSASATSYDAIREPDSMSGINPSFTPPYYDGESWADIVYKHESEFQPTIADIITGSQLVCWRWDPMHLGLTDNAKPYGADNINLYSMQLTSSINLFGVSKNKVIEYTADGTPSKVYDDVTERSNVWTIQPKMETPMLDFGDTQYTLRDTTGASNAATGSQARGMWHQFGKMPKDAKDGIFLEVNDIDRGWLRRRVPLFSSGSYSASPGVSSDYRGGPEIGRLAPVRDYTHYKTVYNNGDVESLLDLVKFNKTSARLGELANEKTVKEAVVAVPYIQVGNRRKFFNIPKKQINGALRILNGQDTTVSVGSSILEMASKMQDYVFPPKMDFIKYPKEVSPIAMYIFEFEHTFSQDDLSYMWQNVRPLSAKSIKKATATVGHRLLTNELMGSVAEKTKKPIQDRLRWMVFKVKQKGSWDYYEKVVEEKKFSDGRYINDLKLGRSNLSATKISEIADYNYNWPYDNFSLVEFIKLESEIKFSDDWSPEEQQQRPETKLKRAHDNKIKRAETNSIDQQSTAPQGDQALATNAGTSTGLSPSTLPSTLGLASTAAPAKSVATRKGTRPATKTVSSTRMSNKYKK